MASSLAEFSTTKDGTENGRICSLELPLRHECDLSRASIGILSASDRLAQGQLHETFACRETCGNCTHGNVNPSSSLPLVDGDEPTSIPETEIVLDLDSTDIPLHGEQEERFFHGYYGHYCYLPLYIVCGEYVLCARLRPSNSDGAKGSVAELERIVAQIRQAWPQVRIIVRGDSGFCRDELLSWCEEHGVDYVVGIAQNARLLREIAAASAQAASQYQQSGTAARVFTEFVYQTKNSWSRTRRVIAKAEHLEKGANPRFVVTSLSPQETILPALPRWGAQSLYEEFYCARGDMENRIKAKMMLFADRTSTSWLRSNQIRLYFSTVAYLLMQGLRRLGLAGTELAHAQCHTVRLKLLKIGAQIRITVRKIWVSLSTGYPYLELFRQVHRQLQVAALRC